MTLALYIIGLYLLVGVMALALFDACTGRVRQGLRLRVEDMQQKLLTTGVIMGWRTAITMLSLATWLFWPAVFAGWLTDGKGGKHGS